MQRHGRQSPCVHDENRGGRSHGSTAPRQFRLSPKEIEGYPIPFPPDSRGRMVKSRDGGRRDIPGGIRKKMQKKNPTRSQKSAIPHRPCGFSADSFRFTEAGNGFLLIVDIRQSRIPSWLFGAVEKYERDVPDPVRDAVVPSGRYDEILTTKPTSSAFARAAPQTPHRPRIPICGSPATFIGPQSPASKRRIRATRRVARFAFPSLRSAICRFRPPSSSPSPSSS